jgi:hypothetical protein
LVQPQPTQTHHRPKFKRLGSLPAGHLDGSPKAGFGLDLNLGRARTTRPDRLHQQQLPL